MAADAPPPPALQLVPGPTQVPAEVRAAYADHLGSADLEPAFFEDYAAAESELQALLHTRNDVVIMSGEGMVALWGAMKSVLAPGDVVVSAANGLYGHGFADMAASLGAEVHKVEAPWTEPLDAAAVAAAVRERRPKLVTMVHCETPTGVLNPLEGVGAAAAEAGTLLLVDFVSSAGGAPLDVDALGIDLGLLGSQKCLSCPPDLGMVSVSERAWAAVEARGYQGYDALQGFRGAVGKGLMPYTHNWAAIRALRAALALLAAEGAEAVQARHAAAAAACVERARAMGVAVYASCPTVTALRVPAAVEWPALNAALRKRGVVLGGCYGDLAGKVFRVGHMGVLQASVANVERAMAALGDALAEVSPAWAHAVSVERVFVEPHLRGSS